MYYTLNVCIGRRRPHQVLHDFDTTTPDWIRKVYQLDDRCIVFLDGKLLFEGQKHTLRQLGAKPLSKLEFKTLEEVL